MGDGSTSYVPMPPLKSRPLSPNLQALQTLQGLQGLTGGGVTGSAGDDDWKRHPESWDREHRRYRPNTTRVQRKYFSPLILLKMHFNLEDNRRKIEIN